MTTTQAEWLALRMEWLKSDEFVTFTDWLSQRESDHDKGEAG